MTNMDPELRRRINTNLRELADGTVNRRETARKEAKAAHKEQMKLDRLRIKEIDRQLAERRKSRDSLQEYLDELLLSDDRNPLGYAEGMVESQYQGMLEECDVAVEREGHKIALLEEERHFLQNELAARVVKI